MTQQHPQWIRWSLPLAVFSALVLGCSNEPNGQQAQGRPPAPVTLTQVEPTQAVHFGEYSGRVRGAREVEVRARVSGILEARQYSEGQLVAQGETLFQIEAGPYETAQRTARAELADARARRAQADREWERVSGLHERNAVSARERDQAQAEREAAHARVEAAESLLKDAERNLRYTRVEAPISGIAGIESVSEGNLIEAGTLLTHLIQHDPVRIHFSLPENDAAIQGLVRNARQSGDISTQQRVTLHFRDGSEYPHAGTINFADRRIDPNTGSVQMRAEFANPDGQLIPGQFVRVRLALTEFDSVVLIDPTAISEGPQGPQVFTVSNDTAHARPVELGPMIGGQQAIISGLDHGDQLVINGHVALGDGAAVAVHSPSDREG